MDGVTLAKDQNPFIFLGGGGRDFGLFSDHWWLLAGTRAWGHPSAGRWILGFGSSWEREGSRSLNAVEMKGYSKYHGCLRG